MKKRLLSLLLALTMLLSLAVSPAFAATGTSSDRDTSFQEYLAKELKTIGMFAGKSDTDFALNDPLTRQEAIVMVLRMLGKISDAQSKNYSHPFTDVNPWASVYVGYAYHESLASGTSATTFGGGSTQCDVRMFLTFTLRALGYSDSGTNPDFTYKSPYSLATSVGILTEDVDTDNFIRADVVSIVAKALSAKLKGTTTTLADKLIQEGVFTKAAFEKCSLIRGAQEESSSGSTTGTTTSGNSTSSGSSSSETATAKAGFYTEYTWLPDLGVYFKLDLSEKKVYDNGYAYIYTYTSSDYSYSEALDLLIAYYSSLSDYGVTQSNSVYGTSYSAWYGDYSITLYITTSRIIVSVEDIYS